MSRSQKQGNPDRAMGLFFDDDDMPKPKKKAKAAGKGSAASTATTCVYCLSSRAVCGSPRPARGKLEAVETNSALDSGKDEGIPEP